MESTARDHLWKSPETDSMGEPNQVTSRPEAEARTINDHRPVSMTSDHENQATTRDYTEGKLVFRRDFIHMYYVPARIWPEITPNDQTVVFI